MHSPLLLDRTGRFVIRPWRMICAGGVGWQWWAMLLAGALALTVSARPNVAGDVDDLLTALDNDDYEVREQASRDLLQLLCDMPENYATVVAAVNLTATPPEARARAQNVVAEFINKLPAVKALDEDLGMRLIEELTEFDTWATALWMGCDFSYASHLESNQMLLEKWAQARAALGAGNIPGAIDKLCAIEDCLNSLTGDQVLELGFLHGTGFEAVPSDKDFLLAKVQLAKIDAVQAGFELLALIQGDETVLSLAHPVTLPGALAIGRGLSLQVTGLVSPGSVESFLPPENEHLFLPRPHWEVVGPVYDLTAVDGLQLAGSVLVGMQFPETLADLETLRIGRVAGRGFELLTTVGVDPVEHRLQAVYNAGQGNSLGEFYLLRVPEPSGMVLSWLGLGCAIAWWASAGRRRRREE